MVLKDEAKLIVLQKDSTYAILTHKQLNLCQVTQTRIICDFPLVMKDFTFHTCIFGIFSNNPKVTKELCQFEFVISSIQPDITYLSHNHLLATNITLLKFECADQTFTLNLPPSQSSIVNINGCACLIKDPQHGQMLPAFLHCKEQQPTPTQLLINDMVPQLLSTQDIQNMGADFVATGIIKLPPLQEMPLKDILKTSQAETYSLNDLLNNNHAIKIFKTPAEKALYKAYLTDYPTWIEQAPNPIMLAIIIMLSILHLKAMTDSKVHTQEIQYDDYSEPVTQDPNDLFQPENSETHAKENNIVIIIVLVLLFIAYKLQRWLRTSYSTCNCSWQRIAATQLYTSIGNNDTNIIIKWQSFKILAHRLKMPSTLGSIQFQVKTSQCNDLRLGDICFLEKQDVR